MTLFEPFLGTTIEIHLSGEIRYKGLLIDIGKELLVLFNKKDYIYIPINHIQKILPVLEIENEDEEPSASPFDELEEGISLRKLLTNAKGVFVELQVARHQVVHGYITNVLNDYFVFHSPVFQTMFISFQHLKALIPYEKTQIPFGLNLKSLPVKPSQLSLARTLEEQLKKSIGQIVVFDLGDSASKIGKVQSIDSNLIELITARETQTIVNLRHLKTVHFPGESTS